MQIACMESKYLHILQRTILDVPKKPKPTKSVIRMIFIDPMLWRIYHFSVHILTNSAQVGGTSKTNDIPEQITV
jgi:hypothetical protein